MFNAVAKSSIPEQIVNYFLDLIAEGELKENDRLPSERELCDILGVSRSTLREGLRILEMMNVIEKRSDGTFVRIQSENILKDAINIDLAVSSFNHFELIEVRNVIEKEAVLLAAQNATPDNVKKLYALCGEMAKHLDNVTEYAGVSADYHIGIARATGNDILTEIFESIRSVFLDYQSNNMRTREDVERSYKQHLEIAAAIEAHDVWAAKACIEKHLRYTETLYEEKLGKEG